MHYPKKNRCNQCGICMEHCPVWREGRSSMVSLLNEASEEGSWNCFNCWQCMEACPSEVDIYDLMMEKRRDEEIPDGIAMGLANIMRLGCALKIEGLNEIRELYDLTPVKPIKKDELKTLLQEDQR